MWYFQKQKLCCRALSKSSIYTGFRRISYIEIAPLRWVCDSCTAIIKNKDHQQSSLSLVVNSGTTDLLSRLGTNGFEELKYDGLCDIYMAHVLPYRFRADLLFIWWFFFLISHRLNLHHVQATNGWFLIWPPDVVCIVDVPITWKCVSSVWIR